MSGRIGQKKDHTALTVELNRIGDLQCYQPFDKGVRVDELVRVASATAGYNYHTGQGTGSAQAVYSRQNGQNEEHHQADNETL